ncbi:MAG: UDP-glucose/GDP-mannose dehydrogenase family protein, partial [Betaproteobacteria bacterium]|nr:UDP-glucose/GDP-mannose dehydrogenase family protein [Betaproteobacteria bacterium]
THFLYPGAGFGGSCLPKDVQALQRSAEAARRPLRILAAVAEVNEAQKHVLGAKIRARFGEDLRGRTFALWGLAFKPNTDDMREAPSLSLIADLRAAGAKVRAYDPVARQALEGVTLTDSAQEALRGCDALAIVTEWAEFRSPDFAALKQALGTPAVFDGRNLYDPAMMHALGFEYFPIGRKP